MTETTLAAQGDIATPDALEHYLRAFELINGYAEPSRPGQPEIVALGVELGRMLGPVSGQDAYFGPDGPELLEGRTFRLAVSPGVVACRSLDLRALDATQDRQTRARLAAADAVAGDWHYETRALDSGEQVTDWYDDAPEGVVRSEITEWSAKSRARMVRTLATLDYSPAAWPTTEGALAMVTLTLPGDWLTVAPDGKSFKALVRRFQLRWTRAIGKGSWRGLWKLEFQGRGAPHLHALMRVPALVKGERFEAWLSRTWADVVAHPDPVERMKHEKAGTGVDFSGKDFSDPRRIALYFLGHSAKSKDGKEYQHVVPAEWQAPGKGPGRFWGYWGLEKAEVELDLRLEDFDVVRREFRKAARARAWEVAVRRDSGRAYEAGRAPRPVHEVKGPKQRRSAHGGGGGMGGGWVLLNDGPAFARKLAAHLAGRRENGPAAKRYRAVPSTWPLVR